MSSQSQEAETVNQSQSWLMRSAAGLPGGLRSGIRLGGRGAALRRDPVTLIASIIFAGLILLAFIGGFFVQPNIQHLGEVFKPPGGGHLFGTDELGRDVMARVIAGARTTMSIAFITLIFNCCFGVIVGGIAGLLGGAVRAVLMRVVDAIYSLPGLLVALVIVFVLGPSVRSVVIALCVDGWLVFARLVEGITSSIRHRGFIEFARISGVKNHLILRRHVLPNLWRPVATVVVLEFARLALAEASISFLGLGVQPPLVSLGMLLQDGATNMSFAWWIVTFPGLYLMLVILCANTIAARQRTGSSR